MTLSTTLIIKDPVPVEALFRFGQSLLGDPATQESYHVPPMAEYVHPNGYVVPPRPNGRWTNGVGQGLAAIFMVTYGADGPLCIDVDPDDFDEPGEYDEYAKHRRGCVKVWMDTAYGYQANDGGGCSDLHAWLLLMLCGWLDQRGAKYEWEQEFTGEWFDNALDVVNLGDPERGALAHHTEQSACG